MRIELFGIARQRAGCESVEVEASDLRAALRALAERHPGLVPEVIGPNGLLTLHYLASLNGERFVADPDTPLEAGDALLILGAQAGG